MLRSKKRYFLKRQTPKTAQKKKERSKKLDIYFDTLTPLCQFDEETKEPIYNPSRINCCHLLPKRIYKSVEDNLVNHIFLSAKNHLLFDTLLDKLDFETLEEEFPNSWKPIVCERVKKLLPLVSENKKLKLKFIDYFEEKIWQ